MNQNEPWVDDYQTRHQAELQARWNAEGQVFRIQNAVFRVMRECPETTRNSETCKNCKRPRKTDCLKVWKEQSELWNTEEEEDQKDPVSVANCTDIAQQKPASSLSAPEEKTTPQSQRHGQPVSGLSLFDLINQQSESEEEAA